MARPDRCPDLLMRCSRAIRFQICFLLELADMGNIDVSKRDLNGALLEIA